MMSYLNNGYDIINYFAEFEKFTPHSIPSVMTVGSQMPELDGGGGFFGSQNTPYKLGLNQGSRKLCSGGVTCPGLIRCAGLEHLYRVLTGRIPGEESCKTASA